MIKTLKNKLLIGRHEWCRLPTLNIPAIKAKIDTGAQTSSIHAFNIKPINKKNKQFVHFDLNPLQGNKRIVLSCIAPVIDQRFVMSSNGHKEHRFVIAATLGLGEQQWDIELTLSNRDPLRYRMLLGLEALKHRVLINPSLSCNQGNISHDKVIKLYSK